MVIVVAFLVLVNMAVLIALLSILLGQRRALTDHAETDDEPASQLPASPADSCGPREGT